MTPQLCTDQALAHHRQGNLAAAERHCCGALKSDGRNAMLLYLLAVALAQQGGNSKALPRLDQSIAINSRVLNNRQAFFQPGSGSKVLICPARATVSGPRSRWKTSPSWLTMKVITPETP
jgi:hypothetical protein